MKERTPGFSTLAIHAGLQPVSPVDTTASLDSDSTNRLVAVNSATAMLEERVAALEGGTAAVVTASGHAARLAAFHCLLRPGDEFISARQISEHAFSQFEQAFKPFGWNVVWANAHDGASFQSVLTPKTKAIFIPSFPYSDGSVTDIEHIASVAQRAGVPLIVDNTLASPYLVKPIDHGADIVIHSDVRMLCGHDHAEGGLIVDACTFDWSQQGRYPAMSEPRAEYQGVRLAERFGNFAFAIAVRMLSLRSLGSAVSPGYAPQILAGLETLALRMQRHCENAKAIAEWLSEHPAVSWVNYASRHGDRYNNIARKYASRGAGAVITFALKGGRDAGLDLQSKLALFVNPDEASPACSRIALITSSGRTDPTADTITISAGLEDKDDLIADLEQALTA